MRVLLKCPTDEACESLHTLLVGTFYYCDVGEDGDVCYTVCDSLEERVAFWIRQAKACGCVQDVDILDW